MLSRRNLKPDQISLIRERQYDRQVKRQGAPAGNSNASKQSRQNGDIVSGRLSSKFSTEYGVSPRTIERDAYDARLIDKHPEKADAIMKGETTKREVIQELTGKPSRA